MALSPITGKQKNLIQLLRSRIPDLADDEEWRDWLERSAGTRSVRALSMGQAGRVIDILKKGKSQSQPQTLEKTTAPGMATTAQKKRIHESWGALRLMGAVTDPDTSALLSYVKRITGVERLEWLTTKQAQSLIEQLKKWKARLEK